MELHKNTSGFFTVTVGDHVKITAVKMDKLSLGFSLNLHFFSILKRVVPLKLSEHL